MGFGLCSISRVCTLSSLTDGSNNLFGKLWRPWRAFPLAAASFSAGDRRLDVNQSRGPMRGVYHRGPNCGVHRRGSEPRHL